MTINCHRSFWQTISKTLIASFEKIAPFLKIKNVVKRVYLLVIHFIDSVCYCDLNMFKGQAALQVQRIRLSKRAICT